MARSDRVNKGVTRVDEKRNLKRIPKNFRATQLDQAALTELIGKVSAKLPHKNISETSILRAVGYLHEDEEAVEKIADAIVRNL